MNNEPVAIRYDFDGYGYQYMDSGSGSDWQTRVDGELLYADPACKHGVDDGACKECYQEATEPVKELHLSLQKSKQTGELLAVTYTDDEHRIVEVLWQRPPELTDEEILIVWTSSNFVRYTETGHIDEIFFNKFARAILRKAK
jgi:hypothetical protein